MITSSSPRILKHLLTRQIGIQTSLKGGNFGLERWNLGLGSTLAERRMALRLSREPTLIDAAEPQDEVVTLPSVARVLATADPPAAEDAEETLQEPDPETGDDDADEDFDDYANDFYADALDDA